MFDDWKHSAAFNLTVYLLVRRFRWVPCTEITTAFWPDNGEESAANLFRGAVHYARRQLEPDLRPRHPSWYIPFHNAAIRLRPGEGYTYDLELFQAALKEADALAERCSQGAGGAPHQKPGNLAVIDAYKRALSFYRGPFVPERSTGYIEKERDFAASLWAGGMSKVLELLADLRRSEEVLELAKSALIQNATHEPFHRQMIVALLETGRRDAALDAYDRCRKMVEDEYGAEPSAELRALIRKARGER